MVPIAIKIFIKMSYGFISIIIIFLRNEIEKHLNAKHHQK